MLIVTPHRWITLILVFLDPDQREQRPRTYTGMFLCCVAVCLGAIALGRAFGIGLEAFYVLLMLDYLWNTWHFASQHHGVYRIYGRMSRRVPMPAERVERYALRAFVVYVLLRVGAAPRCSPTRSSPTTWAGWAPCWANHGTSTSSR